MTFSSLSTNVLMALDAKGAFKAARLNVKFQT